MKIKLKYASVLVLLSLALFLNSCSSENRTSAEDATEQMEDPAMDALDAETEELEKEMDELEGEIDELLNEI